MSPVRGDGLERTAFGALVASLLSPVVAQGLWRPLMHVLGPGGSAERVTGAALAVGAAVVCARWRAPGASPGRLLLLGGSVAAVAAAALSLGLAGFVTLAGVAVAIAGLLRWLLPRLPDALDGLASSRRGLAAVYVVAAIVAVVSTTRLAVFVGDPTRVDLQALPGERFVETHTCLTAYVRASSLARQGVDNVYADPWWYGSNGLPPLPTGAPEPYAPFALDNFSYPPPFLLVASVLAPLDGDFLAQRSLWFGLNGLLVAFGLWTVAGFVDGPRAHRVLLLAPLFFGSLPVLLTLQIGNFHLATGVLSVVAMVALDRGRRASGGALLALAVLSKISPGLLGVGLLAQRRLGDVAWVAGFGALILALAALGFGTNPIVSFLTYALPRLESGAAFPFLDTESGLVTNLSPFGIPFKLRYLGLWTGNPWRLGPWIGRGYTVVVLTVALAAARRTGDARHRAMVWMALLVLAALRSPFCPAYAALGLLWATTLLAVDVRGPLGATGLGVLWLLILVVPPWLPPEARAVQSMVQTVVVVAVAVWLAVRAPLGLGAPAHVHAP